jgi:hypothetical protein
MLIAGDADLALPEHVIAMFRLFGGGVLGNLHPLQPSQLAILPGTSHVDVLDQTTLLQVMINQFLDPAPQTETRGRTTTRGPLRGPR